MARERVSNAAYGFALAVALGLGAGACGGHTAADKPEIQGGVDGGGVGGGEPVTGGSSGSEPVAGGSSGQGGIGLLDPRGGGSGEGVGGATPLLSDGCDCVGDGFGARVRFGDEVETLSFNLPEEARCATDAPAHADISGGCGGDRLSLWLGYDADGAAPQLIMQGSAVTYVDRTHVTWTGWIGNAPATNADAASVVVGDLELTVTNPAGDTQLLGFSYKLCTRYLPRARVPC